VGRNGHPINGARAIMGSRIHPRRAHDLFCTPPWATRALVQRVLRERFGYFGHPDQQTVWEPACGLGHMAEALREYTSVWATDKYSSGYEDLKTDFLLFKKFDIFDWIITNPPFLDKTEAFVLRALQLAQVGVAMFVRLQWLEGCGRYSRIFSKHPPTLIAFFAERVNLCKGRWDPDGTTATAYVWLVWVKGKAPMPPFWIPPGQRESLTMPDDRERFTKRPVIKKNRTCTL